jgi:hypothetical protein
VLALDKVHYVASAMPQMPNAMIRKPTTVRVLADAKALASADTAIVPSFGTGGCLQSASWPRSIGIPGRNHRNPHSDLSHWRKRLRSKFELLLAESLRMTRAIGVLHTLEIKRVTVDTTVQPKAITYPRLTPSCYMRQSRGSSSTVAHAPRTSTGELGSFRKIGSVR